MTVEQNKNIELKTESFVEGYSGENESVVDAKEVDRTPEVVIIEETGTQKSSQSNVKPVGKSVVTINQGEGYSLEDSKEADQNLPCSDACKWRRVLREAIEKKRAA